MLIKKTRILINITSRNRALKLTLFSSLIAFFWKLNQILCEGISHGSSLNRTEESSVFALTKFSPCMLNTSSERRFGVEFSKHSVGFKMVCYHAVKRQIIYIFQSKQPCIRTSMSSHLHGQTGKRIKQVEMCTNMSVQIFKNFMNTGAKYSPPKQRLKGTFLYKHSLSVWRRAIQVRKYFHFRSI